MDPTGNSVAFSSGYSGHVPDLRHRNGAHEDTNTRTHECVDSVVVLPCKLFGVFRGVRGDKVGAKLQLFSEAFCTRVPGHRRVLSLGRST